MRPSEVAKSLKKLRNTQIAVMLHGQPGVGKSQVVHQVAKDLGMKVIDLRLSQLDPVDLRGIPFVDREDKEKITKWIPPEFLPREPNVLLFLDEINSAPQGTQAAAYQLILDRRLGSYKLPEDCFVVGAGNRLQDRAIVHQMSTALKNRMVHIDYDANLEDWTEWAVKSNIELSVLSFIRFKPTALNEFDDMNKTTQKQKDKAQHAKDAKAFATPRSWEFVSRMMQAGLSYKDPEFGALVAGTVGEGAAAEFAAYTKYWSKLPDFEAILLNPKKFTPPAEPQLKYAIATGLAARAEKDNMEKILQIIEMMDPEFQVLCAKDVLLRDVSLSTAPSMQKWMTKNRNLVA
jgi:hypothetical protein